MKKNQKRTIAILFTYVTVFILIGIGFFVLSSIIEQKNKEEIVVKEDFNSPDLKEKDFYIVITTSKYWIEGNGTIGAQYDGIFYNNCNSNINDWTIKIEVPENSFIDSTWNGVYNLEENEITITGVSYNLEMEANDSDTFGFVMYTPEMFNIQNAIVTGHKMYVKEDFVLYWILTAASIITLITIIILSFSELRIHKFKIRQQQDKNLIMQALKTFANFIDAKDPYTKGHSARVSVYTREIARRMGMSENDQDRLSYIALMHDVGKIGIPNEILNKPGSLTASERKTVQMHTTIGAEMLKDFTALPGIVDGTKFHHERYDGDGYPTGLKGKDIPLFARIIGVADSYDAMASDRCYRKRLNDEDIVKELKRCAGTQFDPQIVEYMINMIQDRFVLSVTNQIPMI